MTQPDATVLGVIQARMGSSRLPGKVLQPLHGRPVLSWVCRAARASTQLDDVVVATTTEQHDDAVVDWCAENEIAVVRGSTDDVLGRFLVVADAFRPDAIVRLTLIAHCSIPPSSTVWLGSGALDARTMSAQWSSARCHEASTSNWYALTCSDRSTVLLLGTTVPT